MAFKWRKDRGSSDKEGSGSVKIVSEESGEIIGELKFNFNNQKHMKDDLNT